MTTLRERRRERWRAARPAVAWTLGAFAIALVVAVVASWSLVQAQQECFVGLVACPDAADPRVGWLTFAFFGVPLVWLLGLLLLAVRATTSRRG